MTERRNEILDLALRIYLRKIDESGREEAEIKHYADTCIQDARIFFEAWDGQMGHTEGES